MKRAGQWLKNMSERADLPGETLPSVPVVELAGDSRVLIEQHSGLTSYGTEKVLVQVRYGEICVSGHRLRLTRMTKEQLVISGTIDAITVCRRGK